MQNICKIFLRTGLDPAGPFFNWLLPHLSSSNADMVDIIHTDSGLYGTFKNTGTVNFLPNNGVRVQPGCPQNFTFFSAEGISFFRIWIKNKLYTLYISVVIICYNRVL